MGGCATMINESKVGDILIRILTFNGQLSCTPELYPSSSYIHLNIGPENTSTGTTGNDNISLLEIFLRVSPRVSGA